MIRGGDQLCGRLRVEGPLGPEHGSHLFGPTFRARDEEAGQILWLTIVSADLIAGSVGMSRFMAGAHELERLRHPDLVRLALVDREEHFAVVGFEELPGATSLASLPGALTDDALIERARGLARGLAHLHGRGRVHGLFGRQTTLAWERSMVSWQYGLVQLLELDRLRAHFARIAAGEPIAPELERGELSPAADIYGWGVTVAELATGTLGGEATRRVRSTAPAPGLSEPMRALLRRCLEVDPSRRPADGGALLEALESIAARTQPPAEALEEIEPSSHASGSRRRRPEPTAKLKSLASAHAGDSLAQGRVFQSGSHPVLGEEPDLVALAHEGEALHIEAPSAPRAADSGAALARIELAKRGVGRVSPGNRGSAAAGPGPSPAPVSGTAPSLRVPGPHGPSPRLMAGALAVLSGVLVLLAAAPLVGDLVPTSGSGATGGAPSEGQPEAVDASTSEAHVDEAEGAVGAQDAPESPPDLPRVPAECPAGAVALDDRLCIDAAEYPGLRRIPLVSVDLDEAAELCARRDGRLCTKAEWTRACAGAKERRVYPYGNRLVEDRCNPASPAGFEMEVMPSGHYRDCVTPEGVFDLVGNVGEWVASGEAMGGDSATPAKVATCKAVGRPPRDERHLRLGFRCCYARQ